MMKIIGYRTDDFLLKVEKDINKKLNDFFKGDRNKYIFDYCSSIGKYVLLLDDSVDIIHFSLETGLRTISKGEEQKIDIQNIKTKNYTI